MTTLYGTPPETVSDARNRAGDVPPIVYARAAHFFPDETGRHTLSDDLLIEISRRLKRGDGPLDIVLLTDDAQRALVSRLPMGLALVGIVAEREGWSDQRARRVRTRRLRSFQACRICRNPSRKTIC